MIKKVKRYVYIEYLFIKNCIIAQMQFRVNLLINFLTVFIFQITGLFTYNIIFYYAKDIGGWSLPEVTFLYGTGTIIDSLFMSIFYFNLIEIPGLINNSQLDFLLLKPINSMFTVSFRKFELGLFLSFFAGVWFVIMGLNGSDISFSIWNFIIYCLMIINGMAILYAIFFILKCLAFYFIKVDGIDELFWSLYEFGRRTPGSIYSTAVRFILTYIFPILVVVNVPSGYLLNKFGVREVIIAFIVSLVLLILANRVWAYSLKRYNSASS